MSDPAVLAIETATNTTPIDDPLDSPPPVDQPLTQSLITRLRLLGHVVPLLFSTTVKHFTTGPPHSTWNLKLHLLIKLIRSATDDAMQRAAQSSSTSKESLIRRARAARARSEDIMTRAKFDPNKVRFTPWSVERKDFAGKVWKTESELDGEVGWEGALSGEWVDWVEGRKEGESQKGVVLYLHGGAYYMLSPRTHRAITGKIARRTGCRVLAIDYRLAPEHTFPAALQDAVIAYSYLTQTLTIPSKKIFVMGDSAGGGLTMSVLVWLKHFGSTSELELPGGACMFSPWLDLSHTSGPSWTNSNHDYLPPQPTVPPTDPYNPALMYAGTHSLKHPIMSPLWASPSLLTSLTTECPILIQTGSIECLASDSLALNHILTAHGSDTKGYTIQMFVGMPHVFVSFPFLRETRVALEGVARFVGEVLAGKVEEGEGVVGKGLIWVGKRGEWEERVESESRVGGGLVAAKL